MGNMSAKQMDSNKQQQKVHRNIDSWLFILCPFQMVPFQHWSCCDKYFLSFLYTWLLRIQFLWFSEQGGEKNKRQKRKKTPTLFSDSGFEPWACPAVSGIAFNIALIQQWLICITVLLSKGKLFEKNTELCVINKRLAVEMHQRKQDQNHYKVSNWNNWKSPSHSDRSPIQPKSKVKMSFV